MPSFEPLSGSQKRKLGRDSKEKPEAVISKTSKLTKLFTSVSRTDTVTEADQNTAVKSSESSNQENQVRSQVQTAKVSSNPDSKKSPTQESEAEEDEMDADNDPNNEGDDIDKNNAHSYKSDPALWGGGGGSYLP